jgi:glycosyltransferase involved in cell wall biosynthesis
MVARTRIVSVITSAFNAAATIERAYRSVCAQTYGDWEYIVVDDGSSDETAAIAGGFADARVIAGGVNVGTGAALNRGVREARGSYLAFLDADDEFLPDHIEAHVKAMEENPAIDLWWGGMELVINDESQAWVPDAERGVGLIRVSECVVQGTLFVRRRVFEEVLYPEDRKIWCQDFDFFRRAEKAGFRSQRFLLPTYRYYRDSGKSFTDRLKAGWDAAPRKG